VSTNTVRNVIDRFIRDPNAGVLVLRGKWGVGKTYFWKSCVSALSRVSSRQRYSYVSLFGVSSIQQLQLSTFINAKDIGTATTGDLGRTVKDAATRLGNLLPGSWGKAASFAIESMAPHMIRDLLICFDDFERLSNSGVEFEEVLGFVTTLREEKNCKIVLVFNDEELQERLEVYRRYREKVVDVEVLFEPTVTEAAALAIPPNHQYSELLQEKLAVLQVSNIRLIRKILANVELVRPLIATVRQQIVTSIISMVVLLTWIEYEPDADHPSLEFVREWNSITWNIESEKANKGDKAGADDNDPERIRSRKWSELLNKFGVSSFDETDEAIARVITRGYVEESGLDRAIAGLTREAEAVEAEERFVRAWRLYHDSLEDNADEIVTVIDDTFDAAAPRITPGNVDSTVRLLRNLNRGDLADSLVDRYMQIRGHETELFDLEAWSGRDIQDDSLKQHFNTHFERVHEMPNLPDALRSIARGRGWTSEQISVLAGASEDDLYRAFKAGQEHFTSMAEACLRFAGHQQYSHIAVEATAALKRIAGESRINRLRVLNKFGISPDIEVGQGQRAGPA
jgi:hypothetical protein